MHVQAWAERGRAAICSFAAIHKSIHYALQSAQQLCSSEDSSEVRLHPIVLSDLNGDVCINTLLTCVLTKHARLALRWSSGASRLAPSFIIISNVAMLHHV